MTQAAFILTTLIGGIYFLLKRRNFDYFSVAFFSSVIYFMPGYFGYSSYHVGGIWSEHVIHTEAYAVMIFVLLSILISAWIASRVTNPINLNINVPNPKFISFLLASMSFFGLVMLIFTTGGVIHEADKNVIMEHLGRWHILTYSSATLGLPISYLQRQKFFFIFFFFILVFDLYLGFRSALAIGLISVIFLYLSAKGRLRFIVSEFKIFAIASIFAFFLFGYKIIAFAVKAGMWDVVFDTLSDPLTYKYIFLRSEPFVTQEILNEVISSDFKTDIISFLEVFNQFILFGPELGIEVQTFNDLFQPVLFPTIDYGMASNIWAQMWSAGGWVLLIVFVVTFNLMLAVGNAANRSTSIAIKAGSTPFFVFLAFYIHRNDFGYFLNIEKRLLIIFVVVSVIAYLVRFSRSDRIAIST